MPANDRGTGTRVLVKLRASDSLGAAESRANLRPLFEGPRAEAEAFRVGAAPQWYLADLPDGAGTPWDLAHARIADQLGIASSDVIFAEPDLDHNVYLDPDDPPKGQPPRRLNAAPKCTMDPQNDDGGQAIGPTDDGWHLGANFSQLEIARGAVQFADPGRTRIAHIDTGYYRQHVTTPAHVRTDLERNFVDGDADPKSAEDPDNKVFLIDNSGHGTGTLSILAGKAVPALGGRVIGGAPDATIIPLRISDRVVLFKTSAFARALGYAVDNGSDVVSMSMGGLPSHAWREMIDDAYLRGVCVVTAAGNNFGGLPTQNLVYPARYGRVIAACGVMADGRPYTDLGGFTMAGNYGPRKKMNTAMAAYSPNIPWARFGCDDAVRLNGGGTSSATPQIAAAAALWFEKYKGLLPRNWRRVEAVRNALFKTAWRPADKKQRKKAMERLGQGILRARSALAVAPALDLPQTKSDSDRLAFLRVLTGLGVAEMPPREQMFNLELAQLWLVSPELQKLVPDPDAEDAPADDRRTLKKVMDVIIQSETASMSLRRHMVDRYPRVAGKTPTRSPASKDVVPGKKVACEPVPALTNPATRRLRVYAGDPSLSTRFDTAGANDVTLDVPWEKLKPGPIGEYLEIVDDDPAGEGKDPVNLDDPKLLARDGWAPSAGNPHFHQQMVYAVAMRTIDHFERALGRPVLWRHRLVRGKPYDDSRFVQRLRVRPHALYEANAFYSPQRVGIDFGYFDARPDGPDVQVPGSRVYTCLSHDIVSHETTHAVLDGMHARFNEPTNPDVLAFHEGFADIVSLFQHFTLRDVLEKEIAQTRGDIEAESRLGSLAVQFGHSIGRRNALRNAIGHTENGEWRRLQPDPTALARTRSPHARGSILVAAVFDAFIAIYKERTADLMRISTGGTGVLPDGAIHPDLVRRLAAEASKSAQHVLTMCIRALDYLPPVDVTFFEYLRALITADYDLFQDDPHHYRVAFVEAFRRRGIYPERIGSGDAGISRTLSVETLRWRGTRDLPMSPKVRGGYGQIVDKLKTYADACTYFKTRKELFDETRLERIKLHSSLEALLKQVPELGPPLGIDPTNKVEVHSLRRAMRSSPQGAPLPQIILSLTQVRNVRANRKRGTPAFKFRGGSTLVVDLSEPAVKYSIVKKVGPGARQTRAASFQRQLYADPLTAMMFGEGATEPFAALHGLEE